MPGFLITRWWKVFLTPWATVVQLLTKSNLLPLYMIQLSGFAVPSNTHIGSWYPQTFSVNIIIIWHCKRLFLSATRLVNGKWLTSTCVSRTILSTINEYKWGVKLLFDFWLRTHWLKDIRMRGTYTVKHMRGYITSNSLLARWSLKGDLR